MLQIILALVLPLLQGNSPLENSLEVGHTGRVASVQLGRLNRCDRAALATLLQATGSAQVSKALLSFLSTESEPARVQLDPQFKPQSAIFSDENAPLKYAHLAHCRTRAGPHA